MSESERTEGALSPVAAPDARAALDPLDAALLEQVIIGGDLARLTPDQRVAYYRAVCESLGLNPLTQPFEYIRLQDRLRLYAKREATDQLRRLHNISIQIVSREYQGDMYIVIARATTPDGRTDESTGAVCLTGLAGANLGNAVMKAETKGKRRVTLSICGLGWMDESEVESVPVARRVNVTEDGEIVDAGFNAGLHAGQPAPARQPSGGAAQMVTGAAYRAKLLRRWAQVCAQADALGVAYDQLPAEVDADAIIARGRALKERIAQARQAQSARSTPAAAEEQAA
ncbi:MAG: hypothetical protein ACRDJN_06435 [Chloroflexota bacterium]